MTGEAGRERAAGMEEAAGPARGERWLGWVLAAVGLTAAVVAIAGRAGQAGAAAGQSWPPFVPPSP